MHVGKYFVGLVIVATLADVAGCDNAHDAKFGEESSHSLSARPAASSAAKVAKIAILIDRYSSARQEVCDELLADGGEVIDLLLQARVDLDQSKVNAIDDMLDMLRKRLCLDATRQAIGIEIERCKQGREEKDRKQLELLRADAEKYAKMTPDEYVVPTPFVLMINPKYGVPELHPTDIGGGLTSWKIAEGKCAQIYHVNQSRSGPFYSIVAAAQSLPKAKIHLAVYPLYREAYSFNGRDEYVYVERRDYPRYANSAQYINNLAGVCNGYDDFTALAMVDPLSRTLLRSKIVPMLRSHVRLENLPGNLSYVPDQAKALATIEFLESNDPESPCGDSIFPRKRKLYQPTIGGDLYPRLRPEDYPEKVRQATDAGTWNKARLTAVISLVASDYRSESVAALTSIACDVRCDVMMRNYAAVGLINFSDSIPTDVRKTLLAKLHDALELEKEQLPKYVIRLIVRWGDADLIRKVFGKKLCGHELELEVLSCISDRKFAIARLWELCTAEPITGKSQWRRCRDTAYALIHCGDKRGVDVLMRCLLQAYPWSTEGAADKYDEQVVKIYTDDVFANLNQLFDGDFSPEGSENVFAQMNAWWDANKQKWNLDDAITNVVQKIEFGRPLTKRQARLLAAKLAGEAINKCLKENKTGDAKGYIGVTPELFVVNKTGSRWQLNRDYKFDGWSATVEFNSDGMDEKVSIGYIAAYENE